MVISLIFRGLLTLSPTGACLPSLAEDYQTLDGGLTYRFNLRKGLRWHDGQPVTSRDFAFTHRLYVDPKTKVAYLRGWDKIECVDTPDDRSIEVHLKEPYAPFLLDVGTNPILPAHLLSKSPDLRQDAFNRRPIGCGPFKLQHWRAGSEIALEAFDGFWPRRPRLDRLVFVITPDANTQWNQLLAGEIDILQVADVAEWQQVVQEHRKQITSASNLSSTCIMVQLGACRQLEDVRVRQALDHATPKQAIVSGVVRGLGTVAYADVPPTSPYYNPRVEHHGFNLKTAETLLAQAGYSLRNGTQTRDGAVLKVPICTLASSPTLVQVAEVLKQSWLQIGVETDVVTMEATTLFSKEGPLWKGYDVGVLYGRAQWPHPYDYVNWTSSQITNNQDGPGNNETRYSNDELDRLLVAGRRTTDFSQRKAIYGQIQAILARDVPAIFVYWQKEAYAFSRSLLNIHPNMFGGVTWNAYAWSKS